MPAADLRCERRKTVECRRPLTHPERRSVSKLLPFQGHLSQARRTYTVTNDSPLCAAVTPSSVAFTDFQLFSALMRASQPCTYG
jgi:hypothetical protein